MHTIDCVGLYFDVNKIIDNVLFSKEPPTDTLSDLSQTQGLELTNQKALPGLPVSEHVLLPSLKRKSGRNGGIIKFKQLFSMCEF